VVGALVSPLIFWLLLGAGFGHSFNSGFAAHEGGYMEYFFPGVLVMILLFTAIFSTISIIDDRQAGFLQGVMVAPVSRAAIVLGCVLGATVLAVLQSVLFLILAPFAGVHVGVLSFVVLVGVFCVVGFTLSSIGFYLAWRLETTSAYHAVMNILLLPMWLLSGAVFPSSGSPQWMGWLMAINPLTYGMAAVRRALYLGTSFDTEHVPSFSVSLGVSIAMGLVVFSACLFEVNRRKKAPI
jgi:ABC-2 type transport system permease protein